MMSAGGFSGVSFHLGRCPHVGRLCALRENPHFLVPTIKVRPPDGSYRVPLRNKREQIIFNSRKLQLERASKEHKWESCQGGKTKNA